MRACPVECQHKRRSQRAEQTTPPEKNKQNKNTGETFCAPYSHEFAVWQKHARHGSNTQLAVSATDTARSLSSSPGPLHYQYKSEFGVGENDLGLSHTAAVRSLEVRYYLWSINWLVSSCLTLYKLSPNCNWNTYCKQGFLYHMVNNIKTLFLRIVLIYFP